MNNCCSLCKTEFIPASDDQAGNIASTKYDEVYLCIDCFDRIFGSRGGKEDYCRRLCLCPVCASFHFLYLTHPFVLHPCRECWLRWQIKEKSGVCCATTSGRVAVSAHGAEVDSMCATQIYAIVQYVLPVKTSQVHMSDGCVVIVNRNRENNEQHWVVIVCPVPSSSRRHKNVPQSMPILWKKIGCVLSLQTRVRVLLLFLRLHWNCFISWFCRHVRDLRHKQNTRKNE